MNFIKNNEFIFVLALAVVLSFVIFGNGISGDFVFDDVTVVQNRPDVKDAGNFFNLFISPYHQNNPKSGLYRPFTMATYSLNHNIFGSSPAGFHVVNIFIHAFNSFLVFWLIKFLFKNKLLSYTTFLLFLTHPIHTEAVTSIVGRAELLAFFWFLTTIYLFSKNKRILAATAFLFGLMSKEIVLMVLPIIFYIDAVFLKTSWRKALFNSLFFVYPLAVYSFLRYLALGQYFAGDVKTTLAENVLKFVSFPERIFTAFKVLYLYVEKLVGPVHLSADYSYNAIPVVKNIISSPESVFGLVIFLVLVMSLASSRIRRTGFGFAAAAFFFPYLMVSNLIIPVGTIMGERLTYFPSLWFAVVSALAIDKLLNKGKLFKIAGLFLLVFLIVFYGTRTFIRNKDWRDSRTLFFATVKESPNSIKTRTALAAEYILADEWGKAKEELKIAGNILEDNSHLQNLLGIVADHDGNLESAEVKFRRSIELNPDAINTHINLAELYLKQGKLEEARDSFKKVIDFYPVTEYVVRYAYTQIALNDPDGAIGTVNKYFSNNLDGPDVRALVGTAYFVKHDYGQALIHLKRAQELGNKAVEVGQMIRIINESR